MSSPIIKVEQLKKKFVISHENKERYKSLRDEIATKGRRLMGKRRSGTNTTEKEEFYALNGVDFEVYQGDRLGIIGRNGAGKSTLLKILSRITEPTSGRITLRGRVASLLEVGTGFHPELTGRENIFLNGAILGMSRAEIRDKFDEIVEFAEVAKFLDTPVKRYSSGMYVRLAFAVAAHLEPEILIVDEVLAVGDAQFQKKCLSKMEDASRKEGKTVLFVSHNMASLRALCDKGIYLSNGTVTYAGSITDSIKTYMDANVSEVRNSVTGYKLFDNVMLEDLSLDSYTYSLGADIAYRILISAGDISVNNLCLLIFNDINERIAIVDLRTRGLVGKKIDGRLEIKGVIRKVPFIEGVYRVGLYVTNNEEGKNFFDLIKFEVSDESEPEFIKYPKEVRGVIEVNNEIISLNSQ